MSISKTGSDHVKPGELAKELAAGEVRLIDVRTPLEYGEVHIEGAESMPLDRLRAEAVKGEECVLVCRSGKRAEQAFGKLREAGCEGLRVLEGGMTAWQDAGLPVERGGKVVSLERQVRIAAGLLVLLGVILGTWVHAGFYGLAAFVGAGLTFAGITDWCGMGLLLAKAPWNRRADSCSA